MRQIVGISLAMVLFCTSCDTSSAPSFHVGNASISIGELKSRGKNTTTPITEELRIEGIITANDLRGEFPYTLIVEDATGGIEIAIDHRALADLFPLGSCVSVYCSGLALGKYGGKIQLGAHPTANYSVDRISGNDIGRYIRNSEPLGRKRRPRIRTIPQIGTSDIDTYICIERVRFDEAGVTWCDRDPESSNFVASYRTLVDSAGNRFPVRVARECAYATEPVPEGTGSVNGIIDYFNGELSLRIINYEIALVTSEALPITDL